MKLTNIEIADKLNNVKIGSYELNKVVVGKNVYLTLCDHLTLESEVTIEPQNLLKVCKKIIKLTKI